MSHREFTMKREPLQRSWFRVLQAKIKRPAAIANANPAELDGDIPNMSVGRMLIVIVILHIAGIAGFFAHRYIENKSATEASVQGPNSTSPSRKSNDSSSQNNSTALTSMSTLPQIRKGDERHMVLAGDTYHSIARKWNISEEELRIANDHINLCSGLVLRVPPRKMEVETAALPSSTTPGARAILARPNINLDSAPRAIPVEQEETMPGPRYRVRKGDTFSKIAREYRVSVSSLMEQNGITNDRSLREGQMLKIPNVPD